MGFISNTVDQLWNVGQGIRYLGYKAGQGTCAAVGLQSGEDFFRNKATGVYEEAQESIQKDVEATAKKDKAAAKTDSVAEIKSTEVASYEGFMQTHTAHEKTAVVRDSQRATQMDSVEHYDTEIKEEHMHLIKKEDVLKGIEPIQSQVEEKQATVGKLQNQVDDSRITIARGGEEIAITHLAKLKEAQKHELGEFKATNQTNVAVVRHAFALEVEQHLTNLEYKAAKLESDCKLATGTQKIALQTQVVQVREEKQQYVNTIKASLTVDELEGLAKNTAKEMKAESFHTQETARAESSQRVSWAVSGGVAEAKKAQGFEKTTADNLVSHSGNEKELRTHLAGAQDKIVENGGLARARELFSHAAQEKRQERTGPQLH